MGTFTMDPTMAAAARCHRTRAAIACHLHGVPADIPALRAALPGVPIVEDCAHALGSTLDGLRVGTLGDAAVFSFGPGKQIDAGEAGVLVVRDRRSLRAVVRHASHPARQLLAGVRRPDVAGFSIRPHPVAAMLAYHALASWDLAAATAARQRIRAVTAVQTPVMIRASRATAAPMSVIRRRDGAGVEDISCRPSANDNCRGGLSLGKRKDLPEPQ